MCVYMHIYVYADIYSYKVVSIKNVYIYEAWVNDREHSVVRRIRLYSSAWYHVREITH